MELTCSNQNGFILAILTGRLDSSTSATIQKKILESIEVPEPKLILDTSSLEYVSSDGLRTLLAVAKKVRAAKGKMALVGMKDHIREIYEISGFQSIIPAFPDTQGAQMAFAS